MRCVVNDVVLGTLQVPGVSETMVRRVNNSEVDLKKVKVNRNLALGLVWAIEKGAWVVFLFD